MSSWRQHASFLWNFIRHPQTTGAIAPSSDRLARLMVRDMDLESASTVAEFGAGTGVFTRRILENLPGSAALLVFEINADMARMLRQNLPQAEVIVDSAATLAAQLEQRNITAVDAVICGLPWAIFPEALQDSLLGAVVENLRPGGRFATFAYLHACWFPSARRLKEKLDHHFSDVTATPVVWRNLAPAFIWRCTKS